MSPPPSPARTPDGPTGPSSMSNKSTGGAVQAPHRRCCGSYAASQSRRNVKLRSGSLSSAPYAACACSGVTVPLTSGASRRTRLPAGRVPSACNRRQSAPRRRGGPATPSRYEGTRTARTHGPPPSWRRHPARLATAPRPPSPRRGERTFPWPAGQRAGCLSIPARVWRLRALLHRRRPLVRRQCSSPLERASSRRPGERSTETTLYPEACASWATRLPTGPRPITATVSPGRAAASFKLTPPTWPRRAKGAMSRPTPAGSGRHTY